MNRLGSWNLLQIRRTVLTILFTSITFIYGLFSSLSPVNASQMIDNISTDKTSANTTLPSAPPQDNAAPAWQVAPTIFVPELSVPVAGQGFSPDGLNIMADSAILVDAQTGQILYAKNPQVRRPIASTTKIMTALLALENSDLGRVITVSPRAAKEEGSSLHLGAGEKLTLEQLLYGALICSGNDACVAIAEGVAGSEAAFVGMMNNKAHWMGARHTTFKNTNGMPAQGHLSTAYDLALITRHAFLNKKFNSMVSTRVKEISGTGTKARVLHNTNKMLWGYEGSDGVKTGTTDAAGKCLVASATRGGQRLISVVLHSDDRYSDSIALLNYGFNHFEKKIILARGEMAKMLSVQEGQVLETPAFPLEDVQALVPVKRPGAVKTLITLPENLKAPVKAGAVGTILVLVDGEPVAEVPLTTSGVPRLPPHRLLLRKTQNLFH